MIIDESWQAVKVQCYGGYKGEETPLSFQMGGRRHKIKKVLEGWYEGEKKDSLALRRVFRVVIERGNHYMLVYDNLTDEWYAQATDDFTRGIAGSR